MAAVAVVMARHAGAVGGGIFEGEVQGGIVCGHDEVGGDECGERGLPGQSRGGVAGELDEEGECTGGESLGSGTGVEEGARGDGLCREVGNAIPVG